MRSRNELWTGIIASAGVLVLILDANTALAGATDGVSLCINSVIPSLFPFFVLSILINQTFSGRCIRLLRPIRTLCGIPPGAESILLLGLLGGYPVGAQSINNAYVHNYISKEDGHRLLGFCSNAGPAFIFGIVGKLFSSQKPIWFLWGIHITSALLVGAILPKERPGNCKLSSGASITISAAVEKSIKIMAGVCGWVILFRVIISFCQRWFLWLFNLETQTFIGGVLELTNGCHGLYSLQTPGTRYVFAAVFLGFGGVCVAMQTTSVTKDIGTGLYFPGKVLQCAISFLAAYASQYLIFNPEDRYRIPFILPITALIILYVTTFYLQRKKKIVAILG